MIGFSGFPKIVRLSRECIVTEKIDGTNAQVYLPKLEDMKNPEDYITYGGKIPFHIGSRTRWITPDNDNHGFARWAYDHQEELLMLGPGHHFGEWWGSGIQRGYGLKKGEKRFSLFNVQRWKSYRSWAPDLSPAPECCHVVPVLWRGLFDTIAIDCELARLQVEGSVAAPGFMSPEGIVVWHIAGNVGFKKTLGNDGHKGDNKK